LKIKSELLIFLVPTSYTQALLGGLIDFANNLTSVPFSVPTFTPSVSLSPTSIPSELPTLTHSHEPFTNLRQYQATSHLASRRSSSPSLGPSSIPSVAPSALPTYFPSISSKPSSKPSNPPSFLLSKEPSDISSFMPTRVPSMFAKSKSVKDTLRNA
jgi:hypothetical protein